MNTTAVSNKKICTCCTKEFLIIPQEQAFYERKGLAAPDNCPLCRQKRRLSLRNERTLYKRTCDKCTKDMVSTYRQDSPYPVYCQECYLEYLG